MTKALLSILLAVSAGNALAAPAFAQSAIALGERPIKRTEVVAFVKRQFGEMDSNHDGRVGPAEFAAFRARQGSKSKLGLGHVGSRWFEKADANRDGRVTLQEAQVRPLRFFDMADVNHDGTASIEEQSLAQIFLGN
ncbi:MAG: hypothetical protein JWN69_183 [Alphaproteobacteria bacterium]|nr:hypothetical protein [Alphaproteobacteria bacterium]